jgi:outer membrane biosynthesis protein TonB
MPPSPIARTRISSATSDRQNQSPVGIVGSLLLHGLVVVASLFTWQHKLDISKETPPVVPVELVTLADKTNIRAMVKKPEEPAKPEPAPEIKPQEEFDTPAPVEAKAPAPIEVPPEPAPVEKPKPKVEPKPAEEKPVKTAEKKPPEKKVEKKVEKKTEKKKNFDINNVLALLNKQEEKQAPPANAKTGDRNIRGIGDQNAMTMDLADSLRNQIAQCWSVPAGAPHPERLVVQLDVYLNRDGNVAQPPQLDAESAAAARSDPFMRAAAEAARRAIYVCAPYKLPVDRYSIWRELVVTFDPRMMMGQ